MRDLLHTMCREESHDTYDTVGQCMPEVGVSCGVQQCSLAEQGMMAQCRRNVISICLCFVVLPIYLVFCGVEGAVASLARN